MPSVPTSPAGASEAGEVDVCGLVSPKAPPSQTIQMRIGSSGLAPLSFSASLLAQRLGLAAVSEPPPPSPSVASPGPQEDPFEEESSKLARKDKSLGLLCKKFLDHMNEAAAVGAKIHLESTAASLGVEKRRIYDIVNVMEALDAMSKHTKSFYVWNGMGHLPRLMAELRAIAFAEGLPDRIRDVERAMCSFSLPANAQSPALLRLGQPAGTEESGYYCGKELSPELAATRDRGARNSLSLLCRRFLMVLLCSPTENKVSLDVASTVLIKDPYTQGFEPPSRSRCRRLYDIANVLVAMGIIRKIHYLFGTKKIPLFLYCGPKPDINGPPIPIVERPRHPRWSPPALLAPNPVTAVSATPKSATAPPTPKTPILSVAKTPTVAMEGLKDSSSEDEGSLAASLERRPSLMDMCEVACAERERLQKEAFVLPALGKSASEIETYEAGKALKAVMEGCDDDNKENLAPTTPLLAASQQSSQQPFLGSPSLSLQHQLAAAEERRRAYASLQARTAQSLAVAGPSFRLLALPTATASHVVRPVSGGLAKSGLTPQPLKTPPRSATTTRRLIAIRRPWQSPSPKAPRGPPAAAHGGENVRVRVLGGSYYSPAPTTTAESPTKSLLNAPLDLTKLKPGTFTITGSGSLKRRLPLSPIKGVANRQSSAL